jgi:hypothetical protein
VLLGKGDGTFKSSVAYPTAGFAATGIALADVNGDGKLDAIVGGCSISDCWAANGLVSVLLGIGNGAFRPAVGFDSGGRLADGLAVVDVDGDGKLDVVAADTIDNLVGVLLGNGNGSFQSAQTFPSGGTLAYAISSKDIDGDGKPDVLVSNCSAGGSWRSHFRRRWSFTKLRADEQNRAPWLGLALVGGRADHIYRSSHIEFRARGRR